MPWTKQDFPDTFKNLTPEVREKAIDIANELLDQYEEGRSIRIAMAQAKEWANNRDMQVWESDVPRGKDLHVVPHGDDWAVEAEGSERASKVVGSKDEAISEARDIGGDEHVNIVIHAANGQIEDVVESN